MSRKILFFINPISGTKSKLHLEEAIIEKCGKKNVAFEILFTSVEGDYFFLKEKIEKNFITDVVICGGDGSISPIISALLNIDVNVGIIPLGSGNGLAKTAKIPKSLDKAFDIIFDGTPRFVDAFLINKRLACHVSGIGFDALVAHEFSKQKTRGLSSYTKQALKHFFSAKPYPFLIEAQNSVFPVEAFLISIANSNQFGNNFKIAPQASLCDALLDVVIVKKNNKLSVALAFAMQLLSGKTKELSEKNFQKSGILYFQAATIKIINKGLAPFHIDGDPAETSEEFLIEIIPSAYRLLQP